MCIRDRPCATQNELPLEGAKALVANGCYVVPGTFRAMYSESRDSSRIFSSSRSHCTCLLYTSRCV